MVLRIPYYEQEEVYTCGPAALQMVFAYFDELRSQRRLTRLADTTPEHGTAQADMIRVAQEHGFYCLVRTHASLHDVRHYIRAGLPVIVNYIEPSENIGHFAVVTGFTRRHVILHDPWNGEGFRLSRHAFRRRWEDEHGRHLRWCMVIAREPFDGTTSFLRCVRCALRAAFRRAPAT